MNTLVIEHNNFMAALFVGGMVLAIGWFLIVVNPNNVIISENYNIEVQFNQFEESILSCINPDYDQIRREIETFRIEHEKSIHADLLQKYIDRLHTALDEIEHGISYS